MSWFQDELTPLPESTETIFITDHRGISQAQLELLKSFPDGSLEVHYCLFGDLTLKIPKTARALTALSRFDLTLLVASEAQKRLVGTLFPEHGELIQVRPYPLRPMTFSQSGRDAVRSKLNLREDTPLYGYAGRVSEQKGILELLKVFIEAETLIPGHLLIAGPLEPHPFWQYQDHAKDSFSSTFLKLLTLAPHRVTWIKSLEHEELSNFYSALDFFVSPSFFHDEDFGLAVSEAKSCGRKCILSAWGGHLRYLQDPDVSFAGMKLTDFGYRIDEVTLKEALIQNHSQGMKFPREERLSVTERETLRSNRNFLRQQDGSFDITLYKKIYGSYLPP